MTFNRGNQLLSGLFGIDTSLVPSLHGIERPLALVLCNSLVVVGLAEFLFED